MDYYAKFEDLNQELINILHKIGVTNIYKHLRLIRKDFKKNSTESNKKDITSYYDEESLKAVNELFADDFEHFEQFGFKKYETVEEVNAFLKTYNTKESQRQKNQEILEKYGNEELEEKNRQDRIIADVYHIKKILTTNPLFTQNF